MRAGTLFADEFRFRAEQFYGFQIAACVIDEEHTVVLAFRKNDGISGKFRRVEENLFRGDIQFFCDACISR